MLPALMAAQPLIKYGVMGGGAMLLVGSIWGHGYFTGKKVVHEEWDATIAQASANAMRESVKADAMESKVVKAIEHEERVIEAKSEQVKKKVVHHAKQNPKVLSPVTVALYDELIRLPNETGNRLPASDSGTGAPQVQPGEVPAQTSSRVSVDLGNGETVELTTEELAAAAADWSKQFALIKNDYLGFSAWNDGRERIELERLNRE